MSKKQKESILVYSFSGCFLLLLIIFGSVRSNSRPVSTLDVEILDAHGNFFTDDLEVMDLITDKSKDYIIGVGIGDLDHRLLEKRVEANPFIKDAQVYHDLEGNLKVEVKQSRPIARVFTNGKDDRYIDEDGEVLPVNAKHTARVPLLETAFDFPWQENMKSSAYGTQLFELLSYIERHTFWKAQIAHISIRNNGEVELFPQVTKQTIEFGKPEDFENKFSKLMTFYKEILPKKGWNSYERVNLKFENQIICE